MIIIIDGLFLFGGCRLQHLLSDEYLRQNDEVHYTEYLAVFESFDDVEIKHAPLYTVGYFS